MGGNDAAYSPQPALPQGLEVGFAVVALVQHEDEFVHALKARGHGAHKFFDDAGEGLVVLGVSPVDAVEQGNALLLVHAQGEPHLMAGAALA